jgi:DNA recombination protein RmuC
MEITLVVIGVLAAGMAAVAIALALGRARLMAELAAARAGVEAAERAQDELRAELARVSEHSETIRAALAEKDVEATRLKADLGAAVKAHQEDRNHLYERIERESGAIEARWKARVEEQDKLSRERVVSVERERDAIKAMMVQLEQKFRDVFGSLAGEALKANSQQFMALAEQKLSAKTSAVDELVKPIAETLKKTDAKLAVIEAAGTELRSETGKLVRALREPHVRGRYGEIQLKRVAELAGMQNHCDFFEQDQTRGADGAALRPDMVVKLPNARSVVVDAKTNIQGYLDALSAATPEEADRQLDRFARHVAEQATALARKKYWTQYDGSPEFVVMFIPGDQFIDAALSRQPELLERAAEQGVILASPSTLIGLLRAVAVGYQEQQLAVAAEELRELGKELHERVCVAMGHMAGVGKALNQAVEKYNDFSGSYERRLEPILRKFEENGVKSAKELPALPSVEGKARGMEGQMRMME